MKKSIKYSLLKSIGFIGGAVALGMVGLLSPALAADKEKVTIGYVVSKTGVNAAGAGTTTIPNYQLWVHDVNEAGGLMMPDGTKLPVEVIEYDDRSSTEEVVRGIARLATQDKVDFILPPWGTGFNLAIAPLMDKFGYPHLATTSITPKAEEFVKRWKRSFWFLGGGGDYINALIDTLKPKIDNGTLNNKVAMISVADGFGIELVGEARKVFAEAGFEIVFDKTYPLGTQDFSTLISQISETEADIFVSFSYPPDTFAVTKQAQISSYNPKVFYVGVGAAMPIYPVLNKDNIEGVMSLGGIDSNSREMFEYSKRHKEVLGLDSEFWASPIIYSSLQMLQQAIERKGLDREAVSDELSNGTFDTVIGEIKLTNNQYRDMWLVGQWQDGRFVGVGPARQGVSVPNVPKSNWK